MTTQHHATNNSNEESNNTVYRSTIHEHIHIVNVCDKIGSGQLPLFVFFLYIHFRML